jgi:hypothetical protein
MNLLACFNSAKKERAAKTSVIDAEIYKLQDHV